MSTTRNRVASRSISRPPPAGTKESTVDVLVQLNEILGVKFEDLIPRNRQVEEEKEEEEEEKEEKDANEKQPKTEEKEQLNDKRDNVNINNIDDSSKEPLPFTSLEQLIQSEKPPSSPNLTSDSYHNEIGKFKSLHEELLKSQKTLDILETSLKDFKSNLNSLSSDMELLQNRSLNHAQRLEIRKETELKLAPLVEALIIPPSIVIQISEKEISPQWRAALRYLSRRKNELLSLKDQQEKFTAVEGAEAQLDLVVKKAIERIRDYLVNHIRSLRTSGVNAQAIQGDLITNKELYQFLFKEHEKLALDLRQAYIYTMRWYYSSHFDRYIKSLEKLPIYYIEKSILLGSDEPIKKGLFSSTQSSGGFFYNNSPTNRNPTIHTSQSSHLSTDYLNIGDRGNIISSDDPSVITSHVAEHSHHTTWIESGFRSFNITLVDNATAEYQFLSEFFQYQRGETPAAIFNAVFEPTLHLGHSYTKFLTDGTFDAYGILICIRLCRKLELELQHRKVPVVQDYFHLQYINLWPRFQSIMDSHCESLRRASTKSSAFSATKSTSSSLVPHHITQQFASFLYGVLSLCEETESESEPIANSIIRLRNDFESFLTKTSEILNDSSSKQERFLYNNYFLVSTIISDLEGTLSEQEKQHFKLLTEAYQK